MSRHRPALLRLRDARRYAVEGQRIAQSASLSGWTSTEYMAIRYCLMVVGEALYWVEDEQLASEPDIPWHHIVHLRHRLAHGYWLIDQDILVNIMREEVAPLIEALDRVIERLI